MIDDNNPNWQCLSCHKRLKNRKSLSNHQVKCQLWQTDSKANPLAKSVLEHLSRKNPANTGSNEPHLGGNYSEESRNADILLPKQSGLLSTNPLRSRGRVATTIRDIALPSEDVNRSNNEIPPIFEQRTR